MISTDDGWVVGADVSAHWNGINWSVVPIPWARGYWYTSVFMLGHSDGWAVSRGGDTVRWNGTHWNLVPSPVTDLRSVFMVAPNDGWAVGTTAS